MMKPNRKWVCRSGLPWALCASLGCADWPRYQHDTSINNAALSPEQLPREGVSIRWSNVDLTEEELNQVGNPSALKMGEGFVVKGTLFGLGWSPDEDPDRISECGDTRAFPPASPGNYTGDVDWVSIVAEQNAILCMRLTTDFDAARLDVPLYQLDDCDEPTAVFVQPGSENPIGTDLNSAENHWSIPVGADTPIAIGLAGIYPDDEELSIDWTMYLSMVPSVENAGAALCPEVYE